MHIEKSFCSGYFKKPEIYSGGFSKTEGFWQEKKNGKGKEGMRKERGLLKKF